jgi:hypothetical protein
MGISSSDRKIVHRRDAKDAKRASYSKATRRTIFFEPPPLTAVQKEGFLCVLCASAVNIVSFTTA